MNLTVLCLDAKSTKVYNAIVGIIYITMCPVVHRYVYTNSKKSMHDTLIPTVLIKNTSFRPS